MTDETTKRDLDKIPDKITPGTEIEPLDDEDLDSVAGGFCSIVACSGKAA